MPAKAARLKNAPDGPRQEFERRNDGRLPGNWKQAVAAARQEFRDGKALATRQASGAVLNHLFMPFLSCLAVRPTHRLAVWPEGSTFIWSIR
ncbi:MAG TPA: hypothetical protein VHX39_15200 [Acetobacteraceae bacterium]|nr:hypothetical protein [Acetobacteraceae bacterium]